MGIPHFAAVQLQLVLNVVQCCRSPAALAVADASVELAARLNTQAGDSVASENQRLGRIKELLVRRKTTTFQQCSSGRPYRVCNNSVDG